MGVSFIGYFVVSSVQYELIGVKKKKVQNKNSLFLAVQNM